MSDLNIDSLWDQLVASSLTRKNAMQSQHERSGLARLQLLKEPKPMYLTQISRWIADIDKELLEMFRDLVSAKSPWPLFLSGLPGIGKTCAALALLDHVANRGVYYSLNELVAKLIGAQQGQLSWRNSETAASGTLRPEMVWKEIRNAGLVVLDEVGAREKVSDFVYDTTKQVIDDRFGKPLIVISNLPLEVLGKLYDDRIVSRLGGGTVVGGAYWRGSPFEGRLIRASQS